MARVLVVDDVAADADIWATILANDGHEVVTASDGAAALRACDRYLPDLVITDLELPEMNGLAIIRRLHAVGAEVEIIAISGSASALETAKALGVSAALRKPVAMTDLAAVVRTLLAPG